MQPAAAKGWQQPPGAARGTVCWRGAAHITLVGDAPRHPAFPSTTPALRPTAGGKGSSLHGTLCAGTRTMMRHRKYLTWRDHN